jgi:hypothetical protein
MVGRWQIFEGSCLMRRWRLFVALVVVLAGLLPAAVMAENPFDDTVSLWAQLRGDAGVPPGDPDGFGFARITINLDTGELCYRLSVANTDAPTAAHIHEGAAGTSGPVVVPFEAPTDGLGKGCVEVDAALLQSIISNPAGYYVNVHSAAYPAGVVRGQLVSNETGAVAPPNPPTVTTIAEGLNSPRGIAVSDDGEVYVAQAGMAGDDCVTVGSGEDETELCFGTSGAVSEVMDGDVEDVMTDVTSYTFSAPEYIGPQDVFFTEDGELYSVVGLGASPEDRDSLGERTEGLGTIIEGDGSGGWESVLDVSAYESEANPDGGLIDSNPFSVAATDDGWAISDSGANALLWADESGEISTLATFPSTMVDAPEFLELPPGTQIPMESVPTGVVQGPDGAFYVGELTGFPFAEGAAKVWRVMPGEEPEVYAEGFTNIIDLAFDADGNLWVLEITSGGLLNADPADPTTFAGGLYRVDSSGNAEEMMSEGLVAPAGLAFGPDGALYISNYGMMPGMGEVLKVTWE